VVFAGNAEPLGRSKDSPHGPNLTVERTSASSSAVYSDGLRGWPKPLTLKH
jgi:hypothetical protein